MSGRRALAPNDRRRPLRTALLVATGLLTVVTIVLAVVVSAFVSGLADRYDAGRTVIESAFPDAGRPAPAGDAEDAVTVLLIGSDSRARLDPGHDRTDGGRSDVLMLAHVSGDRRHVSLVSVLRDSWVDVPGHGTAKINAAYSWGGVPLTVQTVEQLLDVRIDHVAEIDFAGFAGMTDALGGVTVESSTAFDARGHHFRVGPNHLDGAAALAFVRERYAFADADHTRVRNQQAFLRALVQRVLSEDTLTSPGRIRQFVSSSSEYLSVDPGLDFSTLVGLGWSLRDFRVQDLDTVTLPTAGGGTSDDGQSYVRVDQSAVASLSIALRSDDLSGWIATHPSG
ncbi:LCP family protein [Curtobacterium herbarum]|uniref:LCP family protein n=1 Tax=Curtobacterium herbarum TaxID=150122 RepID=A0ABN1ZEU9_9MICO|nr:LCP family protein [Curtobacterium herbarum]MBM7476837.1 LCP family protein required for cell wall assembly [Curtobacterium herbarum]MCS6545152.1 LCP family protein [Curtobacterium herbarum]